MVFGHFDRLRVSSANLALMAAVMFFTGPAMAQQVAQSTSSGGDTQVTTVVVTGSAFNTDAAPAKSSVDTTEPETIIGRSYIDNFVDPQSDYVTILSIVPSMTGGDTNGPGLSDGGAKNTLRGLPDGNFAMQYDGIPFGDTNGPTHHNISYFPASTIGAIDVDRGPGNAGNMGANTYGGTIKLFSQALGSDPQATGTLSYGSFDTLLTGLNGQSGDLEVLGTTARVLVNVQRVQSDGALTLQNLGQNNALLKVQDQISPNWTVTLFADYSFLNEHLDDNNGLTLAQVQTYGKNFALQKTDPTLPTYYAYNYTTKATDMDYIRLDGNITDSLKLDNTIYTNSYWNHTFSPNSQTQTLAQIQSDSSSDNATIKTLNGTSYPNNLLAYDKQNAYRVWGDIFRLSQDYDLGWLTGQVRAGVWWEGQATHRYKYYFDANQCAANNALPYMNVGVVQAAAVCGAIKGSSPNGAVGYAKDDEYSDWTQYQPFMEVDIKPTEDLTITPGVKYIHWIHGVNAPVEQGNTCGIDLACPPNNTIGQNYTASFITRDTLPFLTVNYKIQPSWSVYAEYAQGIYVPDISAFEAGSAGSNTTTFPAAETTTNYQLGTVYYADNFTIDADIYYIPISNNYISQACSYDIKETCFVNNGTAAYRGIEAEGTYAFDTLFDMNVQGLSVFANGALNSAKAQGNLWEPNAPAFTFAAGLLYKQNGWKFSITDKLVGQQYSDTANLKYYELPAYNNLNASIGYSFDKYELSLFADNLLNSRSTILITEATSGVLPSGSAIIADSTLDQYFYQAPISFMVSLKAHF